MWWLISKARRFFLYVEGALWLVDIGVSVLLVVLGSCCCVGSSSCSPAKHIVLLRCTCSCWDEVKAVDKDIFCCNRSKKKSTADGELWCLLELWVRGDCNPLSPLLLRRLSLNNKGFIVCVLMLDEDNYTFSCMGCMRCERLMKGRCSQWYCMYQDNIPPWNRLLVACLLGRRTMCEYQVVTRTGTKIPNLVHQITRISQAVPKNVPICVSIGTFSTCTQKVVNRGDS